MPLLKAANGRPWAGSARSEPKPLLVLPLVHRGSATPARSNSDSNSSIGRRAKSQAGTGQPQDNDVLDSQLDAQPKLSQHANVVVEVHSRLCSRILHTGLRAIPRAHIKMLSTEHLCKLCRKLRNHIKFSNAIPWVMCLVRGSSLGNLRVAGSTQCTMQCRNCPFHCGLEFSFPQFFARSKTSGLHQPSRKRKHVCDGAFDF